MSIFSVPAQINDFDGSRLRLAQQIAYLAQFYVRSDGSVTISPDGTTITFDPDLTPGQEAMLRRVLAVAGVMRVTPDEWASIEPEIDNARAYLGLAAPTLAQTAGMTKSLIRILRVLLRD